MRALTRGGRPPPGPAAAAAEVVSVDPPDPAAVEPVLEGAEALYLIWPNFDPAEAAGAGALLGAARRAGVGRGVYPSVLRPQARAMPHRPPKDRVEDLLDPSGLAWRVLPRCAHASNLDGQLSGAATTGR